MDVLVRPCWLSTRSIYNRRVHVSSSLLTWSAAVIRSLIDYTKCHQLFHSVNVKGIQLDTNRMQIRVTDQLIRPTPRDQMWMLINIP